MWIVKAYPKRGPIGPLCSWHQELIDAEESAKICRSKKVYKKVIVEPEQERGDENCQDTMPGSP